jgi:putative ABC transport system permease protein
MLRSFDGLAVRQVRTRRLRALLTAGGIVLGVAMIFGVLLLTGTIRSTFTEFFASVYGRTDVVALGHSGVGTLPAPALGRIRSLDGVAEAQGVVTGAVRRTGSNGAVLGGGGATLDVAAVDLRDRDQSGLRITAGRDLRTAGEVVVDTAWAGDQHIGPGSALEIAGPSGRARLRVVGLFRQGGADSTLGGQGRARVTLAGGRTLLGVPSGFSEIRIVAAGGAPVPALERRVRAALPPGAEVSTPRGRSEDAAKQLQTLNVALVFFGGTALFVGGFLILNAFNMTVLQRTRELGMLRTLGASRAMVLRSVLLEAVLLGVVGTAVGLPLGVLVARGMLTLLSSSFSLPAGQLRTTAGAAAVAVAAGLATSALGALRPAWRAARVPPMRALAGGAALARRAPGPRRAALGIALFLPGLLFGGTFWFGGGSQGALAQVLGLLSMFGLFVGLAVLAPFLVNGPARVLEVPLRRVSPTAGRLAGDAIRTNPARTAATAATLMIGLSVVVVNGVMTASFVGSVRAEIDRAYVRDVTVLPRGWSPVGPEHRIDPGLRARLAALPGAGIVSPVRQAYVELPGVAPKGTQNGVLYGIDPVTYPSVDTSPVEGATRAAAYAGVARGGAVVDTGYARQAHVRVGDRVLLDGPAGTRAVPVSGIVHVVAFGLPSIWVSLTTLRATYGVTNDAQLLVKAARPADRKPLARRIDALLRARHPDLQTLSTADIKQGYENQINQQFAFFNTIVAVAVLISLLGIINTLSMSVLERRREIGMLRALGSSRRQVAATMLDESLIVTLSGALSGGAVGVLIGWVWVRQARSLFPEIGFHIPAGTLLAVALAGIVLGVIASLLPARRAARTNILAALSYE